MNNVLIWTTAKSNLDFFGISHDSQHFNLLISDTEETAFKKVAAEMKRNGCNKIIKINNDKTFEMIYKKKSVWSSMKFQDMISNWMIHSNHRPIEDAIFNIKEFKRNKNKINISIPFQVTEKDVKTYTKILEFYLKNDEALSSTISINDFSYSTINSVFNIEKESTYELFVERIQKEKIRGLSLQSVEVKSEITEISTKFGIIYLRRDGLSVYMFGVLKTTSSNIAELFSFKNGIENNIISYIKDKKVINNAPKKITKSNIFTWSLSLVILLALIIVTFNLIISPKNIKQAFEILLSPYTWRHPWIYLMWVNFFISLFLVPILAVIFFKATNHGVKFNKKAQMNIFISTQIRGAAVFLTGNALLATIIWGWYINSTRGIRVSNLVGTVVSINIVRGLIIIPVGSMFMIIGTIFNHQIFTEIGMMDKYYAFTILSWIGWIWHTIEHLILPILIIVPPLHIAYNKILFIRYGGKGGSDFIVNKLTVFEMNLLNLRASFSSIFKNKERLIRMTTAMLIVIILETFEFTFGLRIVEDYAYNASIISETAKYSNILQISGARYMSGFIRSVPFIELIPGQGLGITELALNNYTYGIINHAHKGSMEIGQIESLSEQTTFIMRFFNFYLKKIISLIITMYFIPKALINRNKKIREGIK